MTARHLVQQRVLAEDECSPSYLRSALEDAGPNLRLGSILFLTLIDAGFDWEAVLTPKIAAYPPGLRLFGLSTGRPARLNQVSTKASILWLDWPGKESPTFVDKLVGLWHEGAYPFSYARLTDDLASVLPDSPRPRMLVRGIATPSFEKQRPFTVSPPPPPSLTALMETMAEAIRTKRPVALRYRNEQGKESRLSFEPLLLGTSGGDWRVWGKGANQDYCLHLSRVVGFEGFRPSLHDSASAAPTRDHFQHCIDVVDVWAPVHHRDG